MASAPETMKVKLQIEPEINWPSCKLLIELTHADDNTGRYIAYDGKTILDANRIESIEEVKHPEKGAVSYITMMSGQAHTVMESTDQVVERMRAALATPGVPGDPYPVGSKPEEP